MKDNILKKQFSKKDVQRARNLVKGKSGERTSQGIGYSKSTPNEYQEGDIWEEGGRTWTIRGGIKENITKLDGFKNATLPLFCPKCKNILNKQLDANYYKSYGECVDCRSKFETSLKLEGKWEDYVKSAHNSEIDNLIKEYTQYFNENLNEKTEGYITEAGDVERWVGNGNKKQAIESLEATIAYLETLKR
tara:strand:- start:170 stop:742 length:573 start_codon:yes stop_codon:yes gene_type:complete